jgi:carbon storage regulator
MEDPPMLVMTRRKNEAIVINGDITVLVVEILEDKVRLGIEMPREVSVHRREVYDAFVRIQRERSSDASSS